MWQHFFKLYCICTNVKILFPRNNPFNNFSDLRMKQWFTPRYRHNRGATFIHRLQTLRWRKMFTKYLTRMLNLPTAGTCQITSEKRFEHKHEWVLIVPSETLYSNMTQHRHHLPNWNTHDNTPSYISDNSSCEPVCLRFSPLLSAFIADCHLAIAMSGNEIR